uniref:AlNc14C114G6460 protein n=1 Tax=Albugo laibachii Nc14 TaxID=890382 RepID=F0WIS5_9STRA|nr:AlNc14C114G6460 [Albugo laibachii Nc14]|eukprot:CCA21169.1 AlNc14C114G6460 [Albugo laibachii Nc14]
MQRLRKLQQEIPGFLIQLQISWRRCGVDHIFEKQALELVERGEILSTRLSYVFSQAQMNERFLDDDHGLLDELLVDFEKYKQFVESIISFREYKSYEGDRKHTRHRGTILSKYQEDISKICYDLPSMEKYYEAVAPSYSDYMLA